MRCKLCGKTPSEILEYIECAKEDGYKSPEAYVVEQEGTYNHHTGSFYCTDCYIGIGMPNGKA